MINYPKTVKIEVTEFDIQQGDQISVHCCPVGLAVQRHFGVAPADVQVAVAEVIVDDADNARFAYYVPDVASQDWIVKFDAEGADAVDPTTITMHLEGVATL